MNDPLKVSEVRFRGASPEEREGGLLGFASITVNGLRLDSLGIRKTLTGRLALSFPSRTDSAGRRHFYVKPLNDEVRMDLEHQIVSALGLNEFLEAVDR